MKFNSERVLNLLRFLVLAAMLASVTACGFKLRGVTELSFKTMYVPPSNSSILLKELRRLLKSSGVTVTPTAAEAEMQFELMSERTQKRILSLSGGGKVAEWELVYQATYRIRDARNELWGQPLLIEQRRDYSYDDTQLLAKDSEEQRLNTEMRTESAREIMRRLSTLARTAPKSSD